MNLIKKSIIGHPTSLKILKSSLKGWDIDVRGYYIFEDGSIAVTDKYRIFLTGELSTPNAFLPLCGTENTKGNINFKEVEKGVAKKLKTSFFCRPKLISNLKASIEITADKINHLVTFAFIENKLEVSTYDNEFIFEVSLDNKLEKLLSLNLNAKFLLDFLEEFQNKKIRITVEKDKSCLLEADDYKYIIAGLK